MKLIGRTLAVLAAARFSRVLADDWLVERHHWYGVGEMGGHGMQSGFNLAGIVEILPTLAIVASSPRLCRRSKQRLLNKRWPNAPARWLQSATPAASV